MKKEKSLELTTQRLVMKPFRIEDQSSMLEFFKNEEIKNTYMIPDFFSDQEYLELFNKMYALSYSNDHFRYGIYLNERLIGWMNDVVIDKDTIELGYVIHPDMKNNGYATEALQAVIHELFRIGYSLVRAGLFESNVASRRVMEKCGMHLINYTEEIEYKGEVHHCIFLEISKK